MNESIEDYLQSLEFEFLLNRLVAIWKDHGHENCDSDEGDYCINGDNYGLYVIQIGVKRKDIITDTLIEKICRVLGMVRGSWGVELWDWGTSDGDVSNHEFMTIKSTSGGVRLRS